MSLTPFSDEKYETLFNRLWAWMDEEERLELLERMYQDPGWRAQSELLFSDDFIQYQWDLNQFHQILVLSELSGLPMNAITSRLIDCALTDIELIKTALAHTRQDVAETIIEDSMSSDFGESLKKLLDDL